MQASTVKAHPVLGKTVKQTAIEEYIDYDHIVAPLASFDTIDLGDDDLTPTEGNTSGFVSLPDASTCSTEKPVYHEATGSQAIRPSELENLPTSLPSSVQRQSIESPPKVSISDDGDLTPTSEACHSQENLPQAPVNISASDKDSGDHVPVKTSNKSPTNHSGKTPTENDSPMKSKEEVPMSCVNQIKLSSNVSAKTDKKKSKKQRKRNNSSSSSEFSDEDSGKGGSGVSWSRRVHIYGKISSTSPTPPSPNLPAPHKQDSTDGTATETIEVIDLNTASASKKKAYLKKLQRLQVKTNPITRPRSATPINVFTLDEYVQYSSPEASPGGSKIKIKLPDEEFSPRNAERETLCFNFNEEDLFSHTKSGILLTNDAKTSPQPPSPRRVLIPPSLTPATSPNRSATSSPRSPRYIYCPSTNSHFHYPTETSETQPVASNLLSCNWVKFDDSSNSIKSARSLSNQKPNSHVKATNSVKNNIARHLSEEKEEVIEVRVVEGNNKKPDCSIKLLAEEDSARSEEPVLESKVLDLSEEIAAALDFDIGLTNTQKSVSNSSVKEEEN